MSTKKKIRLVLICIILVVIGILIAQNTEVAKFKILGWEIETSRIILFSVLFLFGFVAGILTALSLARNQRKKIENEARTAAVKDA